MARNWDETHQSGAGLDSLLERTGFESSVPSCERSLRLPTRDAGPISWMGSLSTGRLARRRRSAAGPLSTTVFFSTGPMVRIRFPPALSPNPLRFGGSHPNFAPSPEFGPINGARSTARRYSYSVLGGTGPGTTSTFGTDWVDTYNPSTGQVIYDGEGTAIRSAILNANGTVTQLANFSAAATEAALNHIYALRTIPSGTFAGDVLVANSINVVMLNSSGNIIKTYILPGNGGVDFSLSLDPNGTDFWTSDSATDLIWEVPAKMVAKGSRDAGP